METIRENWTIIAFFATVVVLPMIGWAIRMGLASKADLGAESKGRSEALEALEARMDARFDGIEREQGALSDRTLRIETEISHLPTSDDIAELKAAVGRTDTRFEGMLREMQSITNGLRRIEDHLLKGVN